MEDEGIRIKRWKDLETDCLTRVLSRVGMESLLLTVPFVCKSWYVTSLNPLCFQSLIFPDFMPFPLFTYSNNSKEPPRSFGPFYDKFIDEYGIDKSRFSITAFVKFVVNRSNGLAIQLKLPEFCTKEGLMFVSDACPLLKNVWLPDDLVIFKTSHIVSQLIRKWKFLESLILGFGMLNIMDQYEMDGRPKFLSEHFNKLLTMKDFFSPNALDAILVQIGTHCKHFTDLMVYHTSLGEVEASRIVKCHCRINRDSVVTVLRGCKELVLFIANQCEGFEGSDEEISKFGSQIMNFSCQDCVGGDLLLTFFKLTNVHRRLVSMMFLMYMGS
ncbi:putative F-box domain, leucine-rich repeat domain, L domain-containing protein [Rosa chinensis]|uniref:Putative F-box domain, leucine-rich repeat domain, L domain-containing protein n=1 Tax=Rosa chinensis TaxID=74649 RepID=A0A2P6RCR8_ROSCH|nr:putative F-box domain, leucine-rich repeat domain, L domain-containing protein [Rosa chinensis]